MNPLSEELRRALSSLTPAEQRVARVLLGDYPRAGLESAARLARRASSSAPTVVRLAVKLGFSGYPELQEQLRQEVAERAASPLRLFDARGAAGVNRSAEVLLGSLQETFATVPPAILDGIAESLCQARDRVVIGGRYSSMIADYLTAHLTLMLPRVRHVPLGALGRTSALLDIDARTVVVAYDFRRYQADTVDFCRKAKELGARVALFTDPWLSPAADWADLIVPCSVGSTCAFDSSTAAMGVTEAVVAAVVDRLGDGCKERLATFEENQAPWG